MEYRKVISLLLLFVFTINLALPMCPVMMVKHKTVKRREGKVRDSLIAHNDLVNQSAKVIIARKENRTTVTMLNDFKGDAKEFALIVPVPELVKKEQVRTVEPTIFTALDHLTTPKLKIKYDRSPCRYKTVRRSRGRTHARTNSFSDGGAVSKEPRQSEKMEEVVKVEETFTVGEYDIVILSATESDGLINWLNENDYSILDKAKEVLKPYINDGMKFFLAKVNLDKVEESEFQQLPPLQVTFKTSKFTVPIRLGMANSNGPQEMIIYALTSGGMLESTNYRTANLPLVKEGFPEFIQEKFKEFYQSYFNKAWEKEGRNVIFKEYSGTMRSRNSMRTLTKEQLSKMGVDWISSADLKNEHPFLRFTDVFLTRLHVKYERENFSQDLKFQETSNTDPFGISFNIRKASLNNTDCIGGKVYKLKVRKRRRAELSRLEKYTDMSKDKTYLNIAGLGDKPENRKAISLIVVSNNSAPPSSGVVLFYAILLLSVFLTTSPYFLRKYLTLRHENI